MEEKNYIKRSDPGSIADLLSFPRQQDELSALSLHGNPIYYAAAYIDTERHSPQDEVHPAAIVLADLEAEPTDLKADVQISADSDFTLVRDAEASVSSSIIDPSLTSTPADPTPDLDVERDQEDSTIPLSLDDAHDSQAHIDNSEALSTPRDAEHDQEARPSTSELEAELDDFVLWLRSLGATPAPSESLMKGRESVEHQEPVVAPTSETKSQEVDPEPEEAVSAEPLDTESKAQNSLKDEKPTEISATSDISDLRASPASEALANLLVEQGYTEEAIQMYRELGLRNPEKKATFAQLIENLSS